MNKHSILQKTPAGSINLHIGTLVHLSILLIFIHGLSFFSHRSFFQYHTTAELFSSFIALGIFIIGFNTSKFFKNDYLITLGIGYFFVSILNLMHTFSFAEMSIFSHGSTNMVIQFSLAAKFIECLILFISYFNLYTQKQKTNQFSITMVLFLLFIFLILTIIKFHNFPLCFIPNVGLTSFKIMSEYVILLFLIAAAFLFFKSRNRIDIKLFIYLESSIILKILVQILSTVYTDFTDISHLLLHIFKVMSFYCMYKGFIELGLKKPYSSLFNKLDIVDNELAITSNSLKREKAQRRQIEEVLLGNEKCYEMIINNSSDAIVVYSEGTFIYANNRAAEFFGAERSQDLISMDAFKFIPEDERELAAKLIAESLSNKISFEGHETKILRLNGKELDVEISSSFISYKGEPAIMIMLRNISSSKQINKLENDIKESTKQLKETQEFNRLMTEFFSNISHELKTPLNVILGAIQVLLLQNNSHKLQSYLKIMKQNCFRILRLVNNIIDLSKLDSGYLKPQFKNLDIVSVIEEITLSVADYIGNKGIELIFDTDTEEKIMAFDADKIERIILNLLSNSLKFTDKGGFIFVNIKDLGEKVRISVRDTGIGIPEDKLHLIFERFGQVDKTLSRNREGSGIGLSLVSSIISLHEGTISVNSRLGQGSEFIIELPAAIVDKEDKIEKSICQDKVEQIKIEFSDIYDFSENGAD